LLAFLLAIGYNLFVYLAPVKRNAYYSNEERLEAYVFSKAQYGIVSVGSSLSGAFEGRSLFEDNYFNLFASRTGSGTGIEIIRRSNKIPQKLYIEINHIDRGIDSALIQGAFDNALYPYKYYIPVLQTRNKMLVNILDMGKKQASTVNKVKPPEPLYSRLYKEAEDEWGRFPEQKTFDREFARLVESLDIFAAKGCKIYFFEMPIDSKLIHSNRLNFQRDRVLTLVKQKGYIFIPSDTSRAYNTGDGVHLLQADRDIYVQYLKTKIKEMNL
jgi:hypothetical protein